MSCDELRRDFSWSTSILVVRANCLHLESVKLVAELALHEEFLPMQGFARKRLWYKWYSSLCAKCGRHSERLMTTPAPQEVTQLLLAWHQGDQTALERLIPMVSDELERLARRHMRGERSGHVLQTTALVNEAYLRLVDSS